MSSGGTTARPQASSVDVAATFHVLGALEVRLGAGSVEIGGPQERAVLALLLTAPGQVLSVSAIVDGLWGDRPPSAAERTVTSYVCDVVGRSLTPVEWRAAIPSLPFAQTCGEP